MRSQIQSVKKFHCRHLQGNTKFSDRPYFFCFLLFYRIRTKKKLIVQQHRLKKATNHAKLPQNLRAKVWLLVHCAGNNCPLPCNAFNMYFAFPSQPTSFQHNGDRRYVMQISARQMFAQQCFLQFSHSGKHGKAMEGNNVSVTMFLSLSRA